jgi:hypothetical protein
MSITLTRHCRARLQVVPSLRDCFCCGIYPRLHRLRQTPEPPEKWAHMGLTRLRKKSQTAWEVPTRAKAPIFLPSIQAGLKTRFPGLKSGGYTLTSLFPQPVEPH